MKPGEIREKTKPEIIEDLDGCKRELLNLRFQWQAGELTNTAQHKYTKKDIARHMTILREMELGINKKHLLEKKENDT